MIRGQAHKQDPYLRPFIYCEELNDYVYLYNPTPNPYMKLSVLYFNNPKFFGNDPKANDLWLYKYKLKHEYAAIEAYNLAKNKKYTPSYVPFIPGIYKYNIDFKIWVYKGEIIPGSDPYYFNFKFNFNNNPNIIDIKDIENFVYDDIDVNHLEWVWVCILKDIDGHYPDVADVYEDQFIIKDQFEDEEDQDQFIIDFEIEGKYTCGLRKYKNDAFFILILIVSVSLSVYVSVCIFYFIILK